MRCVLGFLSGRKTKKGKGLNGFLAANRDIIHGGHAPVCIITAKVSMSCLGAYLRRSFNRYFKEAPRHKKASR